MTDEKTIQARAVPVESITEAPWNVNVIPREKFALLVADMQSSGPEGTDPIDTCMLGGVKYTVDGAHRLRAAKQLGWEYIYELFHSDIDGEEKARLFNFKRDFERGEIDPFRLGASFKWFQDQGAKLDDIGRLFGLDKSTVSRRISLLGISDQARPRLASAAVPVSALEMLAPLPEPVQVKAAKSLEKGASTIRELEWKLPRWKEEYEQGVELEKMLSDPAAKVKKCPRCGRPPTGKAPSYYAQPKEKAVHDGTHTWCLATGELPKILKQREEQEKQEKTKQAKHVPQHVKSKHLMNEWMRGIDGFIAQALPQFTRFEELEINGNLPAKRGSVSLMDVGSLFYIQAGGEIDGKDAHLELTAYDRDEGDGFGRSAEVRLVVGNKTVAFLSVEDGDESGTIIHPESQLGSEKAVRELEASAEAFLERYGGSAPVKRKRGRPPKSKGVSK